jgi:hypothetical protein
MDKKKIQDYLTKTFLSEEVTPGIAVTNQVNKKNAKVNKDGVKAVEKDSLAYNKSLKQDSETSKMAPNKYNYTSDFEKTYHDEMEIMNGMEMNQYDLKPDKRFTKRAEEAIVGSSNMGNNPEWANVVPKQQGFEGPDFGKNLVKKVKASIKKRNEQTPTLNLRGANIQAEMDDDGNRPYAIQENNNNNNKNPQIKESMKRLRFKNEFKGLGNALKLIPEGYKVDNKQFEMTDGNESYRIRWEGNLSEGRAVVLTAADGKLVNEDIKRMKELFGYKSQDTLGLVKGNARINENKVFGDILNKTKNLISEAEEIESAKADEGNWDEETIKAPEATKHIEGSTSTDKGTQAPKAKEGDANKAVSQAAEAKKHVEGSVSTDKGTQAPAPKEGKWEEAGISQAAEAKKHVHLKESKTDEEIMEEEKLKKQIEEDMMNLGKKPMTEEEDEEEGEETEDSWNSSDDEDDSSEEEPNPSAVEPSVPMDNDDEDDEVVVPSAKPSVGGAQLLFSKDRGIYWIKGPGLPSNGMEVPSEFMAIASDKSRKASEKAAIILSKLTSDELDEYGDEHPMATKDAVAGMGSGKVKEYGDEHQMSTADALKHKK